MYEKKLNTYKNLIIFFIAAFLLGVYCLIVTRPSRVVARIEVVQAKIISNTQEYVVADKPSSGIRYYLKVEADKKQYDIGPLANAAFATGMTYNMYLCNDTLYVSEKDAQTAANNSVIPIPFRIAIGVAFLSVIALVYLISAYVQTSKKVIASN